MMVLHQTVVAGAHPPVCVRSGRLQMAKVAKMQRFVLSHIGCDLELRLLQALLAGDVPIPALVTQDVATSCQFEIQRKYTGNIQGSAKRCHLRAAAILQNQTTVSECGEPVKQNLTSSSAACRVSIRLSRSSASCAALRCAASARRRAASAAASRACSSCSRAASAAATCWASDA